MEMEMEKGWAFRDFLMFLAQESGQQQKITSQTHSLILSAFV